MQVTITKEDLGNIARKLDEFSAVLTERERAVLLATFEIAAQAIANATRDLGARQAGRSAPLPSLSSGFRRAFESGVGTRFTLDDVPGELGTIRNIDVDWGNA